MRRADRLFQIIQILRRSRGPVTAAALAAELETSKRSVYRDIASLIGQRVPVRGEAGLGYVLEGGFDLPPLMLTTDEVEAAVLGAQWVEGHGDPLLARAARDLMAKIAAAVPETLRPLILDAGARTQPGSNIPPDRIDVAQTRAWIRSGRKIALVYRDVDSRETSRIVWPVVVGYLEASRMLIGWCELRRDFRNFRADRIVRADFLDERYPARPAALRAKWLAGLSRESASGASGAGRTERGEIRQERATPKG
jgi:predicted DNA-binding transcriptional regulator YafY